MGRQTKREDLLDTADMLFEHQSFGATGINQIAKEAGIVPMTLYNNFENKEALILATLERRSERFLAAVRDAVRKSGDDPRDNILVIFDAMEQWVNTELQKPQGFAGCVFIKAAVEFDQGDHPIRKIAVSYKSAMIDLFHAACKRAGCATPREVALMLNILVEGAFVQAQLLKDKNSVKRAKVAAICLLDQFLPHPAETQSAP